MKICMGVCNTRSDVQPGSSEILTEDRQKLHSKRKSDCISELHIYIYIKFIFYGGRLIEIN